MKEGEKVKRIAVEDIERVTRVFNSDVPSKFQRNDQRKIERATREPVPRPMKTEQNVNLEEAFNQMESEFEVRIKQFREKVFSVFDASEAMIQHRMTDLQAYSGAGVAYQSWDYEKCEWGGMHSSRSVAEQLGNGVVKEVWVWYDKGTIVKVLNREELEKYCP